MFLAVDALHLTLLTADSIALVSQRGHSDKPAIILVQARMHKKSAGRQVSASEMQPGDLVFFDTYKNDGHVGIYIGGGQFIGSQSSTGVAIANMSSGYWKDVFNGRVVRVH